jgi:heme/copper-type cytochrome/quinol oxidase subunit 2
MMAMLSDQAGGAVMEQLEDGSMTKTHVIAVILTPVILVISFGAWLYFRKPKAETLKSIPNGQ